MLRHEVLLILANVLKAEERLTVLEVFVQDVLVQDNITGDVFRVTVTREEA